MSAAVQLDLLDLLPPVELPAPVTCPGCGHTRPGEYDPSGLHYMLPGETECGGMIAFRNHAARDAREFLKWEAVNADDETILDAYAQLERTAAAAAPCFPADTRQSWLEHPEQFSEVTA